MDLQEQYSRLLRYCYMKTKNKYLAEDITQEAFLKFWESRTYKDTGKKLAYLYTIAGNLCIDEFRRPVHNDSILPSGVAGSFSGCHGCVTDYHEPCCHDGGYGIPVFIWSITIPPYGNNNTYYCEY